MVEFFNGYYFLFLLTPVAVTVGLYFALRKAPKIAQWLTVFTILAANFALHFLKLKFAPYNENLPMMYRKISLENVCAVSTVFFPFLFVSKNKVLRDYIFYVGVISAFAAHVLPTEALDKDPWTFDVLRFYLCHAALGVGPMLMVLFKLHKLEYKRLPAVPAMFLLTYCLIGMNEIVLIATGFTNPAEGFGSLFNPDWRNHSGVYGPPKEFVPIWGAFEFLIPEVFTKVYIGDLEGTQRYWPILWAIGPIFFYIGLLSLLLSLPWEAKHIYKDTKFLVLKIIAFVTLVIALCKKLINKVKKSPAPLPDQPTPEPIIDTNPEILATYRQE